jgi:hypothetical protein
MVVLKSPAPHCIGLEPVRNIGVFHVGITVRDMTEVSLFYSDADM